MITTLTKETLVTSLDAGALVTVIDATSAYVTTFSPTGPASAGSVNPSLFFQTSLKLAELDTPEKKTAARQNLELQNIDCGTFN